MSYTYTVLEVSPEVYKEIASKLIEAGYEDQVDEDEGLIDMHGLALKEEGSDG